MRFRNGSMVILACAMLIGTALFTTTAKADYVYTYTGLDFTSYASPFTSTESVTGSFVVATPLGDNMSFGAVNFISYSFSDGVDTFTLANSAPQLPYYFDVATNSSGAIIAWGIDLDGTLASNSFDNISSYYNDPAEYPVEGNFDNGSYCTSGCFVTSAPVLAFSDVPGTWTVSQTPLPPAIPLFATGLGALGLLSWRRKPKAAALAA